MRSQHLLRFTTRKHCGEFTPDVDEEIDIVVTVETAQEPLTSNCFLISNSRRRW